MLLPLMRDRLLSALTGTPDVLGTMLGSLGTPDALWDIRRAPARFTLREIVAHLADYEAVWADRLGLAQSEASLVFAPRHGDAPRL